VTLGLIGLIENFWAVVALIAAWGLLFAASMPIRQAYMNGLIPSRQRATILSFDSMMASTGGVWTQPALGRAADMWGYATSYVIGAGISALAVPFLALSRRENDPADVMVGAPVVEEAEPVAAVYPATAEPHPCAPTTVTAARVE
jgi:MFS family permease